MVENNNLVVFWQKLEVGLRVVADGALLRSSFADYDMAAVRALPDAIAFAGEDYLVLDVLQ